MYVGLGKTGLWLGKLFGKYKQNWGKNGGSGSEGDGGGEEAEITKRFGNVYNIYWVGEKQVLEFLFLLLLFSFIMLLAMYRLQLYLPPLEHYPILASLY